MIETPPTSLPGYDPYETIPPTYDPQTIPDTLLSGRYRIERVVGEGAFGRVYLATDTRLRAKVAIKELLTHRHTTIHPTYDRYLSRFQREARAGRGAQHPNIVTVYDLHVDNRDNHYLVMEYVDGFNLRDLLKKTGALPVERAVSIAIDIASALEAVHEQGIVHRDIKPANIMITGRGVAKLTDFGIALVAGDAETTLTGGPHPGTPAYMSPEQAAGHGSLDGRSDLYSLGIVLYEMLAGQPFAPHRFPLQALRPDLSIHVLAIVNGLLQADVRSRYQTALAVVQDLQRLTSAPPPPPLPPSEPTANRSAIIVGVGIVAVAMLVFALYLILQHHDPTPLPPTPAPPIVMPTPTAPPTAVPPTPTSSPKPPTTVPPTTVPPTVAPPTILPAGETTPWAAPNGIASLRYPNKWTVIRLTSAPQYTVGGFSSGDGTAVYLNVYDPQQGSVSDEIQIVRQNQAKDTINTYTDFVVTDTRINGEPAQLLTFIVAPKSNPSAKERDAWWVVNHDNREFGFYATNIDKHRVEVDTVVNTVTLTTTWSDLNSRVRLQVPVGWKITVDTSDDHNILRLDGPDGTVFVLRIFDPAFGTIDQEIQDLRNGHTGNKDFIYKDGTVTDLRIGNESAKTFLYTSKPKSNVSAPESAGAFWEVNHNRTEFQFQAFDIGTHRAEMEAIIASVTFLK